MFQIKPEEIEVTPKMAEEGAEAIFRAYGGLDLVPHPEELAPKIYRAMEKARRQIGIVWGEPPIEPPKG